MCGQLHHNRRCGPLSITEPTEQKRHVTLLLFLRHRHQKKHGGMALPVPHAVPPEHSTLKRIGELARLPHLRVAGVAGGAMGQPNTTGAAKYADYKATTNPKERKEFEAKL